MDYAHVYLLGPDISKFFHEYYLEMVGGISDTISIYSEPLGRNMDYIDICTVSATPDLSALAGVSQFLCTSISAWNSATEGAPELSGTPAVSRNLVYF